MLIASPAARKRKSRIARTRAVIETLESRMLLSGVSSFALPGVAAFGITHDNSGNLWIADPNGTIDKVTLDANGNPATVTPFSTNGAVPGFVTFNPTNNLLYFADQVGNIGVMDTNGNLLNSFAIPDGTENTPGPLSVAPDGSIWFAGSETFVNGGVEGSIIRMDTSGNFTEQVVPALNSIPVQVAPAADGTVWFTELGVDNGPGDVADSFLGHASYSAGSGITETLYSIPTPLGIMQQAVVAPDGSVWYSEAGDANSPSDRPASAVDLIGHAVLSGGNVSFTEYDLPKAPGEGATNVGAIKLDSSGRLWMTENSDLSYFDTTTDEFTRMTTPAGNNIDLTITNNGVYETSINGDDNLNAIQFATFTPPVSATEPDIVATTGQPFSGAVSMFVSDQPGDFTYTLNYGDGNVDSGTVANNSSGVYTIDGSQTYATTGSYNTTLTITDAAGDVSTFNGTALVNPAVSSVPLAAQGINLAGQRGTPLAANVVGVPGLVVAQFAGNPATYTATIHWGDNTTTAGVVVSTGNNQYYVTLPAGTTKTYSSTGTFNVSVLITDGTHSVTATSTATISETPPVVSQNLTLQPLLANLVLTTTANFTDDPTSNASWFRATINWGDGTTSLGLVIRTSSGHYTVIGAHIYSKKGTYNVTTLVSDTLDDLSATGTAKITIKTVI